MNTETHTPQYGLCHRFRLMNLPRAGNARSRARAYIKRELAVNAVTAAMNCASATTVKHMSVSLFPTASKYSCAMGIANAVAWTDATDCTEKRSASMYARPMSQEPAIEPTTASGARSSARLASSATWAAVSQPSRV